MHDEPQSPRLRDARDEPPPTVAAMPRRSDTAHDRAARMHGPDTGDCARYAAAVRSAHTDSPRATPLKLDAHQPRGITPLRSFATSVVHIPHAIIFAWWGHAAPHDHAPARGACHADVVPSRPRGWIGAGTASHACGQRLVLFSHVRVERSRVALALASSSRGSLRCRCAAAT